MSGHTINVDSFFYNFILMLLSHINAKLHFFHYRERQKQQQQEKKEKRKTQKGERRR